MRRLSVTSLVLSLIAAMALGACGDDDAAGPDASAGADAAPPDAAPPCPTCSYEPQPLADGDFTAAELQDLAERFNPAHIYTGPVLFAMPVQYALEHNTGLFRAKVLQKGPYWMKLDLANAEEVMGVNPATADLATLPVKDGQGNDIAYYVDTPGDNTGPGLAEETWTTAWTMAGGASYKPTQYAHFFWLSKPDGYLAIQYWFFYPFNKFSNNHEADWEHMNVVVQRTGGDWKIVMAHFSFHAFQSGLLADQVVRVADKQAGGNGDHPVAFVGGEGCQVFGPNSPMYCGSTSGASFPYPGFYGTLITPETAAGGTTAAGRAVHANDFEVVVLPRPSDAVPASLSFYKLPIFLGHPEALANAPAAIALSNHRAPVPPGPYHFEFEEAIPKPFDLLDGEVKLEKLTVPAGWTMINDPTQAF